MGGGKEELLIIVMGGDFTGHRSASPLDGKDSKGAAATDTHIISSSYSFGHVLQRLGQIPALILRFYASGPITSACSDDDMLVMRGDGIGERPAAVDVKI